jgi:hypothetical protein
MTTRKHDLASGSKLPATNKRRKIKVALEGSGEDVLLHDVKTLLKNVSPDKEPESNLKNSQLETPPSPFSRFDEIQVRITEFSSLGDKIQPIAVQLF